VAKADALAPIAAELARILAPHGFRRSGRRLRSTQVPDVVRDLTVEAFRWNLPGMRRFRLVIEFYLATGEAGEFTFPRLPGRFSLAFRIGDDALLGDASVFRPMPDDATDPAFLAGVREHVTQTVLPLLDAATSVDAVVQLVEDVDRRAGAALHAHPLAVALARQGRAAQARELFRRGPGDREVVRLVAAQYGIDLDG
jgi:hypothetical protein